MLLSIAIASRSLWVTVKSSISLTDEQHAFARTLVEAGRHSSLSAVLQQGIDLLRQRMHAEEAETAALRDLLSRRSSGRFVSAQEMDKRPDAMIAEKRRAHGDTLAPCMDNDVPGASSTVLFGADVSYPPVHAKTKVYQASLLERQHIQSNSRGQEPFRPGAGRV